MWRLACAICLWAANVQDGSRITNIWVRPVNRAAGEDGRTDREPGMDSDAASRMWLQDKLTQLQKAKKEKSAFAPKLVPLPPSIFGGNISLELWDLVI